MAQNFSIKNIYSLVGISVIVIITAVVFSGIYFLHKSFIVPSADESSKPETVYFIGDEKLEPTISDYNEIDETHDKLNYLLLEASSNKPLSNIEAYKSLVEIREDLKANFKNSGFDTNPKWLIFDNQLKLISEDLLAGTISVYDAAQKANKVFDREVVS